MSEYTPRDAAQALGISEATLRKHAREFASFLSASAQGGPTARRRYQDSDITLLRRAAILLAAGQTYTQVRHHFSRDVEATVEPRTEWQPVTGVVEVIERGEGEALTQVVEAQRQAIAALQQSLAAAQHITELQRQQLEALERGLVAAEQRADQERQRADEERQRGDQDRADLITALERARADEAQALEALRSTLGKIPRWLRALLGIGP